MFNFLYSSILSHFSFMFNRTIYAYHLQKVAVSCIPLATKYQKVLEVDICVCIDEKEEHVAVYFSDRIKKVIFGVAELKMEEVKAEAAKKVLYMIELMEQSSNRHALSEMLLAEWILAENKWTVVEWNETCTAYPKDGNDNYSL